MIRASAPGSIMITGEHAVVYGHRAIVAAIEQRITVGLTPRSDRRVGIASAIAEPFLVDLDDLTLTGPYRFVLGAVSRFRDALDTGFDLEIASAIDPTLGLGSSAAVTIATLGAVASFAGLPVEGLHQDAFAIVRSIQGRGSGADLAASLMGGMLAYRAPPDADFQPLPTPPHLSLRYCGYKTPTGEVLQQIATRMQGREAEFTALYATMGESAETAISAARQQDWAGFAAAMTAYQGLMERLGVSDETLDDIVSGARQQGVLAAKISGSGLGDCVLALGDPPTGFTPVTLAETGLVIDG